MASDGQDPSHVPAAAESARAVRGRPWRTVVGVVFVVLALGIGAFSVWRRRDEVAAALAEIGLGWSLLALVLIIAGVAATAQSWLAWLSGLGHGTEPGAARGVFFLTQAGKYVPGAVWPVLAQAAAASRLGMPRAAMPTATVLFLVVHVSTGVVVGAVALWGSPLPVPPWLLVVLGAAVSAAVSPPVLARMPRKLARRVIGVEHVPGIKVWVLAHGWMLLAWSCYGAATWLLLRPLAVGTEAAALAVGAYALSWVVGMVVIVAPAGAGPRDVAMVLILDVAVTAGAALSVTVLSRVLTVVADLLLAVLSVPSVRRWRRR